MTVYIKCLSIFLLFLLVFAPFTITSAQSLNAGFVQGLWYGDEPIFAERQVRIFVALRNNAESDLTGTIRFTDNGSLIGEKDVSALSGRLVETWMDWNPSFGEHILEAVLINVLLHSVGEDAEPVTVTYALARDELTIDYDTDEDGIENSEDEDDDNDGITDEEEIANGTDPLVYDEPADDESETSNATSTENGAVEEDGDGSGSVSVPVSTTQGLEKYFDDGVIENALSSITSNINNVKSAVDTYRARRTINLSGSEDQFGSEADENIDDVETDTTGDSGSISSGTDKQPGEELATITRTTIPIKGEGLFSKATKMVGSTTSTLYTFALWLISIYLTHPAFVQITLLLLVLYLIYHFARKVTRRPIKKTE